MTTTCTSIVPIPLPADDYDRHHSLHAVLSSFGAASASFDAAMDALTATSARQRLRVADLEARIARFREALGRLDDVVASAGGGRGESPPPDGGEGGCLLLRCPGTYEGALLGTMLRGVEDGLSEVRGRIATAPSAGDAARRAADGAVRRALSADASADDGGAVPSDAWLDHSSSGLGASLELAGEMRSVPPILGDDARGGEADYRRALEALVLNAASRGASSSFSSSAIADNEARIGGGGGEWGFDDRHGARGGGGGDDESVYSTTSQMSSSMSVASGNSTRMTAGQRRRWHKHQVQTQGAASGASSTSRSASRAMMPTALSPHIEVPRLRRASAAAAPGRQQSRVGSQPYLCEVFHDAYGIGAEPPRGLVGCPGFSPRGTREGGTEFYPPPGHVTDLHVFNTARNSYGPTVTMTTMGGGGAAASAGPTTTFGGTAPKQRPKDDAGDDDEKTGPPRGDVSPASAVARKKQPSGGPEKQLLS